MFQAGVFLPQQFRVFHKGGELFRDLALRSQLNQPSCAIVFGSSTAGGAYHPALSDYTVFVEDQAQVFLAGPPLVKMATGEIVDAEELGGAKVHATMTGLADSIASDECVHTISNVSVIISRVLMYRSARFDAISKAREWIDTLPASSSRGPLSNPGHVLPPRYSAEDLLSLVSPDVRRPLDMREVLLRIVDDSRMSTFKPEYGRNLITSWARISGTFHHGPILRVNKYLHQVLGYLVGIVANQVPIINPDEASKGAQFIRMCNQQ